VKNEEVLHRIMKKMNILNTIKTKKENCVGHVLERNGFLKRSIEVIIGKG
jgi:hypothetical protein